MFLNNLIFAFRLLRRNKFYSIINTIGLSRGKARRLLVLIKIVIIIQHLPCALCLAP